jgi:FeS assembly protein SufD
MTPAVSFISNGQDSFLEVIKKEFKNEASRFNGLRSFQPTITANITKPKVHIAEILLQAGLFKLLGSNIANESFQWIFYNGLLLSAPAESLFPSQYLGEHLTLTLPKQDAATTLDSDPTVIYLIHIMNSSDDIAYSSSPKISILGEENSHGSIVECYINLGSNPSFVQANTHIILKNNAKIDHSIFTQHQSSSPQISQLRIQQASKSEYRGFLTTLGSALYKTNILLELMGPHARSEFNILMTAKKSEYASVNLTVHHSSTDCQSRIMARSVLQDQSHFDFMGKIMVDKIAEKTDARLENKNLLLSQKARANTEPQLEIYNGNIQCSHGATVGHLDENALFYLQSRGISRSEAIQMLIEAFLQPIMQSISQQPLRNLLESREFCS